MRIVNPAMGELEIDPGRLLELPAGLIGLPDLTRFAVVDLEKDSPFRWLQSISDPSVGFIITEPTLFVGEYRVEVRPEWLSLLGVDSLEETVVFVIVTLGHSLREVTANLRAPVIASLATRKGFQAALTDSRYSLHAALPPSWTGPATVLCPDEADSQSRESESCWS